MAAAVLCYINLLNYMNWFIIAGEEEAAPLAAPTCLPTGCPASSPHCASMVASIQQTSWGAIPAVLTPGGGFSQF